MELKAKLSALLPLQTGTGKNGEWKKQDIILETSGQYPKKVCVSLWGDKIDNSKLQIGNNLTVSFDIESREYNGRWYTDVKAWKVEVDGAPSSAPAPARTASEPAQNYTPVPASTEKDDLPF